MVIGTLTEADFEPVDVDGSGRFAFSNALLKLRRSIAGIHNKIYPVLVLNDSQNPVRVTGIPTLSVTQQTIHSSIAAGAGTTTVMYTVPGGKRFTLQSANVASLLANSWIIYEGDGATALYTRNYTATNPSDIIYSTYVYIAGQQIKIYGSIASTKEIVGILEDA